MTSTLTLDGALGEGGGQVLRSALSLSLLTGTGIHLVNVRANRDKPGLRPQHLAAVQAAGQICGARIEGDRVGSQEISFAPGPVRPGDYLFDIGTAGATALVLQTLLLPLARAAGPSTVTIRGGTHVPWSPCFHYLDWHWRPLLARMGIPFELELVRAGFYPRGGGEIIARVPGAAKPRAIHLPERGRLQRLRGLSAVASLPLEIAERQAKQASKRLALLTPDVEPEIAIEPLPAHSQGTVLLLLAEFEQSQACFFALGERHKKAEQVANEAVDELAAFLHTDGAIDPWLADQLLLPLALAGAPSLFRTSKVTLHLLTNAEVIRHFLPVVIEVHGTLGEAANISVHS